MLGSWGDLVFEVSAAKVRTFEDFKRSESTRWATHDIHMKKSKSEFLGESLGKVTFTMNFRTASGLNPMDEVDKLIIEQREGKAHTLIVGSKRFGTGKYVIKSLDYDMKYWSNKGDLLSVSVNVSMEEYV